MSPAAGIENAVTSIAEMGDLRAGVAVGAWVISLDGERHGCNDPKPQICPHRPGCGIRRVMVRRQWSRRLAADDQDENALPDVKFFRNVMRAIGLRNGQEAGVEPTNGRRWCCRRPATCRRPRPRLAHRKQPGVAVRSGRQAAQGGTEDARRSAKPYDYLASGNPLTPTELAAGKTDKPSVKSGDGPDQTRPESQLRSQLGYVGGLFKQPDEPRQSIFQREKDRNRDIQARAGAGVADRSAGRLSLAVADPALRRQCSGYQCQGDRG